MYPENDWIRFADVLQNDVSVFSSSDRTSLINDAFALAASGRLKYSQALNLTLYLGSKERCSSSWQTAFLAIDNMADILYFNPIYAKLVSYLSDLLKKPYEELGWYFQSQDSLEQIKLRTLILKKMCTYGSDASAKAGEMLLDWKNTGNKIDPNLREVVYRFGMKKVGDMGVWKWMLEKYRNESNAQEKQKLLLGLTSVSEPWILSHFLYLAEDSRYFLLHHLFTFFKIASFPLFICSIVRSQDYFILLTYMAWNPVGQSIVWDYVRENWPKLVDRFTLNDRYMGKMISDITKKFSSSTRLEEMKAFFAKYPNAGKVSTMYQKYLYLIHFLTSL